MRRSLAILLLCSSLLLSVPAAQAGSIFTASSLGEMVHPADARLRAMGGTGLALTQGLSGSLLNPALMGGLKLAAVTFTARPEALYARDDQDNNVLTTMRIENFALYLPLGKQFAMSLDFRQRSDFNFKAYEETLLYGEPYTKTITHTGGTSLVSLNFARSFGTSLYAGFRVGYVFGSMKQVLKGNFEDTDYLDAQLSSNIENTGSQYSGGLAAKLGDKLSAGLIYTFAHDIKRKDTTYSSFSPTVALERTYRYPSVYGLGLSYRPSPKLLGQLDVIFTKWSDFQIDGQTSARYQDVVRIATGFEFRAIKEGSSSYLRVIPLRFGYAFEPWYRKTAEGAEITGHFLTLGIGLPFGHRGAHLDASLELGIRGDVSSVGAEEKVVRGTLSIWGFESWFQRRK
ncbi:hypothetical protein ACFL0G_01295 [Candidatus Zixiibacteriota bacterium]